MIIATTHTVPGEEVKEILGIARGNTVRARWFGRDIAAGFKSMVGGEVVSYTEMLSKARDEAIDRMTKDAEKMGADAVLGVFLASSEVVSSTAELVAYGTAVKLK
jgi:uncharacterized protein YbjQ (UPF0145 family)